MPDHSENYFRYFNEPPDAATWGFAVTAAGFTRIGADMPYPPVTHPKDHALSWSQGRVLDALQLVLITKGRGVFETVETGCREVVAGMAFVLLPRTWHRYRPDKKTGWDESWMEVRGPLINRLIKTGVFNAGRALRGGVLYAGAEAALEQLHSHSRKGAPGFSAARMSAAFAVIAAWEQAARDQMPDTPLTRAVADAERYLSAHYTEAVSIQQLAKRLGVSYSHLRRTFKEHTGFSPWQYVIHLRLTHARRLLSDRAVLLDDVATRLGFNSAFHLSSMFKQTYGVSPRAWRKQLEVDFKKADG